MAQVTITRSSDREHLYHTVSFAPHVLRIASRLEEPSSDSDSDCVDPYLFDADYTLAAATGFSVWEGAIALLGFLHGAETPEAEEFRRRVVMGGEKVVELGSGTGIGGLGVAALGGRVLMTDVQSVCNATRGNVMRNAVLASASASSSQQETTTVVAEVEEGKGWVDSTPVGLGFASVQPLDWSTSLALQQKPNDPLSAPIIVAAEVAWLEELVPMFVATLAALLAPHPEAPDKVCYWAYKERGTERSKIFTTMRHVKSIFEDMGCEIREVWKTPSREDTGKFVIVNIVKLVTSSEQPT
ncbi:hypothetical protein HKX48_006490 [Thoreauomyces humboldtii]|nr:hypothetical protein HKX48_006490 [Thoreauomyces humboldtii]